jgi:TetR/AcrR family transcriptional regulator, cholesterol catabolism regulator
MTDMAESQMGRRRALARSQRGPDYNAKRAEIVRAAADVFREKGYAKTKLVDVANKVDSDRASVYYYFGSKEELFQECITETVVINLRRAKEINSKDLSPREKLQELIAMLVASQVEHYPYMYVYMQEDMARVASQDAEWAKTMVKNTHRMERYFLDIVDEGIKDGSFRSDLSKTLIANSIFGMTQWTHRWWVPGESRYSTEDLIRTFTAVLLEGIDTPRRR